MEEPVPFQVQLERRQHRRLKALAERRGQSMGSLIRESVATYLAALPPDEDPLLDLIGAVRDGASKPHGDVSVSHDAYLGDAYAAELAETNDAEPTAQADP